MKKPTTWLVAICMTLLGPAALAACSDDGGNGDGDGTDTTEANGSGDDSGGDAITVVATEFVFDPDALDVAADEEFTIELDNQGAIEHDFNIEDVDAERVYTQPGETASGSFTVAAGEYVFFCSIPGHRESGMEGTLTAQ